VEQISRIRMDTSKHVFQLHGVNAAEAPVVRKKLRRARMVAYFEKLEPTMIAILRSSRALIQSAQRRPVYGPGADPFSVGGVNVGTALATSI
jgi:hypothetical protein